MKRQQRVPSLNEGGRVDRICWPWRLGFGGASGPGGGDSPAQASPMGLEVEEWRRKRGILVPGERIR